MKLLDQPPRLHPATQLKIAIVTGLSNSSSCCLSAAQTEFLSKLEVATQCKVAMNFPFLAQDDLLVGKSLRTPNIVQASVANGWQFWQSRRIALRARPHWQALLESCQQLLLITGSCGLQIAIDGLRSWKACHDRIKVLALGPVAISKPEFEVTSVRGERDWISKPFCRRPDHLVSGLNHLGYWGDSAVREISRTWLRDRTLES